MTASATHPWLVVAEAGKVVPLDSKEKHGIRKESWNQVKKASVFHTILCQDTICGHGWDKHHLREAVIVVSRKVSSVKEQPAEKMLAHKHSRLQSSLPSLQERVVHTSEFSEPLSWWQKPEAPLLTLQKHSCGSNRRVLHAKFPGWKKTTLRHA